MSYQILVVEDQKEISDVIVKYLQNEGYDCLVAEDGFKALAYFNQQVFHLVLLDVMMPGIDGFEVLQTIRRTSEIPVIMITAKNSEIDRINGFDYGVDDYVTKPFSPRELMGRVKVVFKRVYHDTDELVYTCGQLKLYTSSMRLFREGEEILITSAEFNILQAFFTHIGKVLSRDQLISLAFGETYDGYDRNIDTHIKRLRQKLEIDPKNPQYLLTKYGAGYQFGGGVI